MARSTGVTSPSRSKSKERFFGRAWSGTSVTREQVAQARELGTDPKTGKPVTVRMGRYGPFVQIGTKDDEEKPRFAGLRPGQKMNEVTLGEALELFKLPRKLGETPDGLPVSASVGAFMCRSSDVSISAGSRIRKQLTTSSSQPRSISGSRWCAICFW